MSREDWTERRAPANDASRAAAENHRQPWCETEDAIIREYWMADPDGRDELAIAELLGRTTEACLYRAHVLRRGTPLVRRTTTTTTTITETVYRGWREEDGDGC